MSVTQELKEFAIKGNVIDLAVGKLDFSSLFWVLGEVPGGVARTLDDLP